MRRLIAIAAPTMLLAACLVEEPEPEIGFRPDEPVCDACPYTTSVKTAEVQLDAAYANEVVTRVELSLVDLQSRTYDYTFADPGVTHLEVTELRVKDAGAPSDVRSATATFFFLSGTQRRSSLEIID